MIAVCVNPSDQKITVFSGRVQKNAFTARNQNVVNQKKIKPWFLVCRSGGIQRYPSNGNILKIYNFFILIYYNKWIILLHSI
jgi:hypothetical protein